MKKVFGIILLVTVLLTLTILRETTGTPSGGSGAILIFPLVGIVLLAWNLLTSKKDNSSNNNKNISNDSNDLIVDDFLKKTEDTQTLTGVSN